MTLIYLLSLEKKNKRKLDFNQSKLTKIKSDLNFWFLSLFENHSLKNLGKVFQSNSLFLIYILHIKALKLPLNYICQGKKIYLC